MSQSFWSGTGLLVTACFLAFFIGFAGGRRRGKREGFAEGLAYAPLEMRRLTWERGACVVCGTRADSSDDSGGEEFPSAGISSVDTP